MDSVSARSHTLMTWHEFPNENLQIADPLENEGPDYLLFPGGDFVTTVLASSARRH